MSRTYHRVFPRSRRRVCRGLRYHRGVSSGFVDISAAEQSPAAAHPEGTLSMLLVIVGRQIAARVRPAFEAVDLNARHIELMMVLSRYGSTSQQQLAEALRVDPSIMVGLLNELERDGMVRRIRDSRDRRRHLVEISPQGLATLADNRVTIEAAEDAAFAALADDDRRTLRRLLTALRDSAPGETCTPG
jgi:DNA-binding MarR family transcriptional regulator